MRLIAAALSLSFSLALPALAQGVAAQPAPEAVLEPEAGLVPEPAPRAGADPEPDAALDPIPRPATEGETEADIEAEAQPAEEAAPSPLPVARPGDLRAPVRTRPQPGWTLRDSGDDTPLALAGGPGQVASVAAFCLGGRPWLALELEPAPESDVVRTDFGFTGARIEAEALREDGAGGAYVIELGDSPLAGLLAGADSVASLGIDGTQQGPLSLAGSSASIRAALAECHEF